MPCVKRRRVVRLVSRHDPLAGAHVVGRQRDETVPGEHAAEVAVPFCALAYLRIFGLDRRAVQTEHSGPLQPARPIRDEQMDANLVSRLDVVGDDKVPVRPGSPFLHHPGSGHERFEGRTADVLLDDGLQLFAPF